MLSLIMCYKILLHSPSYITCRYDPKRNFLFDTKLCGEACSRYVVCGVLWRQTADWMCSSIVEVERTILKWYQQMEHKYCLYWLSILTSVVTTNILVKIILTFSMLRSKMIFCEKLLKFEKTTLRYEDKSYN